MATQSWMVAEEITMTERLTPAQQYEQNMKNHMNRRQRRIQESADRRANRALDKRIRDMERFLRQTEGAMRGLRKTFAKQHEIFPCLQFQRISSDLASICEHLEHLREFGPTEAHREIPLEESEIKDEVEAVEPPPIPEDAKADDSVKDDSKTDPA